MTTNRGSLLIDAHVHLYDLFDRTKFLDAALANFRASAKSLDLPPASRGCLMLTEKSRHHFFRAFRAEADSIDSRTGEAWSFRSTGEAESLVACRDEKELLIVAGRQVKTRESLEVLALGCDMEFPDGLPLAEALDLVLESPATVVLPWGFGKWWSRRGRLVKEAVLTRDPARVFLGDNSARLNFLPPPPMFRIAQQRGMFILPGTDPLPFAPEETRPGSYGFELGGAINHDNPAADIKKRLSELTAQPRAFGELETLGRFIRNQIGMQARKRG